jgi:hypothetical protein
MLALARILAIPDNNPDHIQMGISAPYHRALVARGGITKGGEKAKVSVLRKDFSKSYEKAGIKGDKPLPEKETVISSKSSTGEVVRVGDKIYKNDLLPNGKKTLEGEVYKELKGVDGIADGKVVKRNGKEQIEIPFYKNIISIDDIPKQDRTKVSNLVSENVDRINGAIAALSDAGYAYNDPLQFGFAKGKMDLIDFSNASKPTDKRRDVIEENYGALAQFYKDFGLEGQAKIVSDGIRMRSSLKSYEDDEDVNPFLDDAEQEKQRQVKRSGVKARNVYYSRNARAVQLRGIGQTEMDDDVKYIFSEKPLAKKDMEDWDIKPIFEQKK